ncbi:ABC transporter ATP-binding protein [Micromonospora sp. NBC_01392]|uniref:ABC transporter ATP-binding protein n=1 Tax=Micromonospora sp. NBC_01392 TaxID=2903588 RepID=UPI00324B81FF
MAGHDLRVSDLTTSYSRGAPPILSALHLTFPAGESFAIVGESGSGKTTLARVISGLMRPLNGEVTLGGESLWADGRWRGTRRVQYVPQDPSSSLNPRMTVGEAIAEVIDPRRPGRARTQAVELLRSVGLSGTEYARYPHELSGGQRQRIAISRAIAVRPEVLVADEITSALDSTVQAEVLSVLADLRRTMNLSLVLISHDLAVVSVACSQAAVLYRGTIVEAGLTANLLGRPRHPYTRLLLDSVPGAGRRRQPPVGPSARGHDDGPPGRGCVFRARCSSLYPGRQTTACERVRPQLVGSAESRTACHVPLLPTMETKMEENR